MEVLFVFLGLVVAVTYGIVCPPDICARVSCMRIEAKDCNGRVDAHGGYCGCCPSCVNQAGVNERCISSLLLLGVPQNIECADELYCNKTTGVCQKKTCAMKLHEVQATLAASNQGGKHLVGVSPPRCDTDDTYSPLQCSGSVCYCVNKTGDQLYKDYIHSTSPYQGHVWEQSSMNCRCAIEQHNYVKTGLIGKFFFCADNGNYENVGCTGSVCYCMDKHGQQVGKSTVNISQKDSLNC